MLSYTFINIDSQVSDPGPSCFKKEGDIVIDSVFLSVRLYSPIDPNGLLISECFSNL